MSDKSLAQMLEEARKISEDYAQRATELSNFLVWFENQLKQFPSKVDCQVTSQNGFILTFTRHNKGWGLLLHSRSEGPYTVRDAPADLKVQAAKLVQQLAELMLQQQYKKLKQVEESHEAAKPLLDEWKEEW